MLYEVITIDKPPAPDRRRAVAIPGLEFPAERWENSYKCSGIDEIRGALAIKNTIPNANAVLMSKAARNNFV